LELPTGSISGDLYAQASQGDAEVGLDPRLGPPEPLSHLPIGISAEIGEEDGLTLGCREIGQKGAHTLMGADSEPIRTP
jgi:hypothetical protein